MNKQLREQIEKAASDIFTMAQQWVDIGDEFPPFICKVDEAGDTSAAMLDGVPKDYWPIAQKMYLKDCPDSYVAIATEAWVVQTNKDDYEKDSMVAPSKHPARTEAIVIVFATTGNNPVMCRAPINRKTKKLEAPVWMGFEKDEVIEGRLTVDASCS
jgi:hypothetical protein